MVNRTQALVLGFSLLAWTGVVALLVATPAVAAQAFRLPPGAPAVLPAAFPAGLTAFLGLLAVGVLRRWRWLFWLVAVAFLAGGLRVPVAVLELGGWLPAATPGWYVLLQGGVGLVQVAIGLAMLAGYRRAGVWGAF
jgi:hypothetical protein